MGAWSRETFTALLLALRAGIARPRQWLLVAAGFQIATSTLLIMLTIPAGLDRVAAHTGRADIAIVLASKRMDEADGNIGPELVDRISVLPGVSRNTEGKPLVAPQFVVHANLRRHDGSEGAVLVRGATEIFWEVVGDAIHMEAGTRSNPGLAQWTVGREVADSYVFTQPGTENYVRSLQWRTSGVFSAGGGMWESEIWTDKDALSAAYSALGQTTLVWVRLTSPTAFDTFAQSMKSDPRLRNFQLLRQQTFYAQRVAFLSVYVRLAALIVALILGLEAALAISNATGLSLHGRQHEFAVLRAIGYRGSSLIAACVAETLLIGFACAAIATVTGFLLLRSYNVVSSIDNLSVSYSLSTTPEVVAWTFFYAMLLGFISALAPAWYVTHRPLASALARD